MDGANPTENIHGIKVFIGIVVIVVAVVGAMYYLSKESTQVAPPISLEVSTDKVIVVVNGEEIIQKTINDRLVEASQTLISQGINVNNPNVRTQVETQLIEDTINGLLLKQGAEKAGITADIDVVEETFQGFVTQAGGEVAMATQLAQAGLSENDFKKRLAGQIIAEAFISENVDLSSIEVTEEEIAISYNNAMANSGNLPPLTDARNQIEQQILNQKRQPLVKIFIDSLRQDATIEWK